MVPVHQISMNTIRKFVPPFVLSIMLVFVLDLFTNNVTEKYLFDSNVYISIAKNGFGTELLIAPFIYRYASPLLAGAIHHYTGLSIYKVFKLIMYAGGISQLLGIFLIVNHLTKSQKSAYIGMLTVAFSMYNLKFLLFDIYRPDALAYTIILLSSWFALKKQFTPLIITTMVGLQVREFTIVPLLAFLGFTLQKERNFKSIFYLIISGMGLFLAIGVPRILIPIVKDGQDIHLSLAGIGQAIQMLQLWRRNLNIVYVCFAYFLPFLILYRPKRFKKAINNLSESQWRYILYYMFFVFLLICIGGTDMERFASYFFLPMALFVGLAGKDLSISRIFVALFLQFIFNRIWLPFPIWDFDLFIDFYGGWSATINTATLLRYTEVISLAILGIIIINLKVLTLPFTKRIKN
jgi:hypothetical protein